MKNLRQFLFLFIFLTLITGTINAQLTIGVKAGLSSSSIKMDDLPMDVNEVKGDDFEMMAADASVGFHFGALGRIKIATFFVQPEFYFTHTAGAVKIVDLNSTTAVKESVEKQKFNKIDVPILVGVKFGPARVNIGPVASFMISNNSSVGDFIKNEDVKEDFKKATWGFQGGVGLDIWKLGVDLRYEGNLGKIGNEFAVGGKTYKTDSRNNQIIVSVAYYFGDTD